MDPYDQLPGQDPVTVSGRVATARTKRYLVVAGVLAGGVTLGALFSPIGLAGAQEGGSGTSAAGGGASTPTTQASGDTTPGTDAPGDKNADEPADGAGPGNGKGDHHGRGGHHGFFGATDELATVLGLSSDDLWSQLAQGKSLGEIADAQGVSRDTVADTLTKGLADHLAEEVAEGDLTQSEADTRLAEAKDAVATMIDKGWGDWAGGWGKGGGMGPGMGHDHGGMGLGRGADLQGLADSLGIDLNQLRTDVMGGKTVAEAAAAQGVNADDLKSALVAEATKHIDQALADGRIDQARADELKAGLDTRIDDLINGKAGDLGGHGGWGGGMGHGWGGPMGGGHHGNGDGTANSDGSNNGDSGSGGGETQQSSFQA